MNDFEASADFQAAADLLGMQGPSFSGAEALKAFQYKLARTDPKRRDDLWAAMCLIRERAVSQELLAKAGAQEVKVRERKAEARRAAEVAARRKEQKALAAKAAAIQHAADVSDGWPESWKTTQVRHWAAAGRDLETAQKLTESGWDSSEILELLDYPGITPNQEPPAGTAADHRIHGDSLVSILRHEWPPAPSNTIVSLKRTLRSGRRERWTISESGGRLRLRQASSAPKGNWRTIRDEDAGTDIAAAITANGALRTVRRGAINEYTLSQGPPEWRGVLSLLRVSAAGGDEDSQGWPDGVADAWSDGDEYIREIFGPAPVVNRWCTIEGLRLVALQVGRKIVPLQIELYAELEDAREIARSTWFSESGGAPISWDGGNSLSVVDESLLWTRQWGDQGQESEFFNLPRSPLSLAGLIADWVISIDAEVSAAFALESFDPKGTLSAEESEIWGERFESVDASLVLTLDADVLAHLRRRLARSSPLYLRTRKALRRPQGVDGQALATALDAVLRDGVLGHLYGNWEG